MDVGGRQGPGGVLSCVAGCCESESFNSQPTQVERSGDGHAALRAVAVDRRGVKQHISLVNGEMLRARRHLRRDDKQLIPVRQLALSGSARV